MTLDNLLAREAIRHNLACYNWNGDFLDVDAFVSTFAEDGVLEIKGMGMWSGRAALREAVRHGFGQRDEDRKRILEAGRAAHHVSSIQIKLLDAGHATSDAYFLVLGRDGPDHWGRYRDRLVKVGEAWLFAHRRVSVDGAIAGSTFFPRGVPA
jgi:hypothetical protein